MPRLHQGFYEPRRFFGSYYLGQNNFLPVNSLVGEPEVTSLDLTGGYIYAGPFFLPARMEIKQYGLYIMSVPTAGRNLAYGIYGDGWDVPKGYHYPQNKLDEDSHSGVSGAGYLSKTLSTPLKLAAGLYWFVYHCDTTGVLYPGCTNYQFNLNHYHPDTSWPLVMCKAMQVTRAYSTPLPDPFPTGPSVYRFIPICFLREVNQDGT